MRGALSIVAIAALAIAGVLALVSAGFVTIHLLDPRYPTVSKAQRAELVEAREALDAS